MTSAGKGRIEQVSHPTRRCAPTFPSRGGEFESRANHLRPPLQGGASRGDRVGVYQQFVIPGTSCLRLAHRAGPGSEQRADWLCRLGVKVRPDGLSAMSPLIPQFQT
jgi:hypothetical protein